MLTWQIDFGQGNRIAPVLAHNAIKQYATMIRPLCEDLLSNMGELGNNADSFVVESDKVALIRQI